MPVEERDILRITRKDNVAIVVNSSGLDEGARLEGGIVLRERVPQGHKVALDAIEKGDPIVRYGETIGYAAKSIERGDWVNESSVLLPQPPALDGLPLATRTFPESETLEGYTFEGYRNADGSVGTRNILGITTSVQCVAGIVDHVVERIRHELLKSYPNVDDVVALNHSYGCGVAINAPAAIVPIRTIRNIALNPNFGGEVMVIGLGCEKLQPTQLFPSLKKNEEAARSCPAGACGCEPQTLSLQDERLHGFQGMVDGILEIAETHLQRLDRRKRETCPASELVVGMQCGGSDAFSGVTANPAIGYATDLLVRAGATVLFSEVTEVRDAIHLLTPRAATEEVARDLIDQMQWYDDYLAQGQADRSANPSPGNKKGGLSNVVEKALGSIVKSGSGPISGVLAPGEKLSGKGLYFAATPASDFICGTLQLAAGMNMHVFSTGRGTPYGLSMVPVVKVSTNTALSERWHDLIDLDAGVIASGEKSIEETGLALFELILEIASGRTEAAAERLGLRNDLVLFNPGPVT